MSLFISILYGISAVCLIGFGYFRYLDASQTSKEKEETRFNYHLLWRRIDNLQMKSLPYKIIIFSTKLQKKFSDVYERIFLQKFLKLKIVNVVLSNDPLAFFLGSIIYIVIVKTYGKVFNISIVLHNIIIIIYFLFFAILIHAKDPLSPRKDSTSIKYFKKVAIYISLVVAISFPITTFALYLGDTNTYQEKTFPLTIHFLNIIFDFLTIYFTIYFLKKLIKNKKKYKQFLLIIAIIISSAFCAIAVLVSIKFITNYDLSYTETIYTLIGRSSDGSRWEINEWFWVMHTTFIPILIYLIILILSILAKKIVLPISKIIGKASVLDQPHWLTANFFL